MADFSDFVERFELVERLIRREQIVRDRLNPMTFDNDVDFINRFRLSKDAVLNILNNIDDNLNSGIQRISSVSPLDQLLLTLRYYSTGNLLSVNGDLFGVHKCTVSRIIRKCFFVPYSYNISPLEIDFWMNNLSFYASE